VVEKLSSGLLNALFVPKALAALFPAKPRIVPLSGLTSALDRLKREKTPGGVNRTILAHHLYCTESVQNVNAPIRGRT
jgi:hypothetical protein